jgi:hypothetical protein
MKQLYRFTPGIIVIIYLFFFMAFRSPERSWDRIINSDGKGYYAYLPAIFIYHDLQFKFVEQYEYQYYPLNKSVFKEFRQDAGEKVVNKYFPGLAILWLPFFLFGHLMAWLEIFPRDGYSLPYQYSIALSAFVFLYLGAKWLMKLLELFGASDKEASWITLLITLGTNLVFYVIIEPSMTHVYSFALITGFLYASHQLFHQYNDKWLIRSLTAFTLIFLIRPTNGLVLMTLPFVAGDWQVMKNTATTILSRNSALIRGMARVLILLMVPVSLWYLQTGKFFVYTYGDEKLNFLQPHMWNILFSYNRGWFLYTPVALLSMAGFIWLYRNHKMRFYSLLAFLMVFIYLVSCWWVWYYASKFGQRVFIDIYPFIALLLLFLYKISDTRIWSKVITSILLFLTCISLFQFWQHANWIFPPYNITSEVYRDALFSVRKSARVYIPREGITGTRELKNDMEKDYGLPWMNPLTRNDTVAFDGKWSSKADRKIPYSIGAEIGSDTMFTSSNRLIKISAMVYSPREVPEATLVVDYQKDGKSLSYNQFILDKFVSKDEWTKIEAAFYLPVNLPERSIIKIYFYNPSSLYKLYVDNMVIELISLKNGAEYAKIEGVLLPEQIK